MHPFRCSASVTLNNPKASSSKITSLWHPNNLTKISRAILSCKSFRLSCRLASQLPDSNLPSSDSQHRQVSERSEHSNRPSLSQRGVRHPRVAPASSSRNHNRIRAKAFSANRAPCPSEEQPSPVKPQVSSAKPALNRSQQVVFSNSNPNNPSLASPSNRHSDKQARLPLACLVNPRPNQPLAYSDSRHQRLLLDKPQVCSVNPPSRPLPLRHPYSVSPRQRNLNSSLDLFSDLLQEHRPQHQASFQVERRPHQRSLAFSVKHPSLQLVPSRPYLDLNRPLLRSMWAQALNRVCRSLEYHKPQDKLHCSVPSHLLEPRRPVCLALKLLRLAPRLNQVSSGLRQRQVAASLCSPQLPILQVCSLKRRQLNPKVYSLLLGNNPSSQVW